MSPVGQASEHHEGVAQALFDKEVNVNDIPSLHQCSLSQDPPVVGVYVDVPNRNGGINAQVFEKSALYRWIVTAGDEPRSHQISAILSTNSLFFAHQRGTWYVQLPSIYRTPPSRKNCVESCHGV